MPTKFEWIERPTRYDAADIHPHVDKNFDSLSCQVAVICNDQSLGGWIGEDSNGNCTNDWRDYLLITDPEGLETACCEDCMIWLEGLGLKVETE